MEKIIQIIDKFNILIKLINFLNSVNQLKDLINKTKKKAFSSELTVRGFGSRIRFNSFFASGENHDGHVNWALPIWKICSDLDI